MSILYLCLGCQFLAHSVFIPHILFIFYALWSDSSSLNVWKECNEYMEVVSKINKLTMTIFSDHTSGVVNVGDCILCCRWKLPFLYHERHSLIYVLLAEYVKLSPYNFCQHCKFWCKYLQTEQYCSNIVERYRSVGYTNSISVPPWT